MATPLINPNISPLSQTPASTATPATRAKLQEQSATAQASVMSAHPLPSTGQTERPSYEHISGAPPNLEAVKINELRILNSALSEAGSALPMASRTSQLPKRPLASATIQEKYAHYCQLKKCLHDVRKELTAPKKLKQIEKRLTQLEKTIQGLEEKKPANYQTDIEKLTGEKGKLQNSKSKYQKHAEKQQQGETSADDLKTLKSALKAEIKTYRKETKEEIVKPVRESYEKLDATPLTSLQARIHGLKQLDKALSSLQEYKAAYSDPKSVIAQREKIQAKIDYLQKISLLDQKSLPNARFVEAVKKTIPRKDQTTPATKYPVSSSQIKALVFGSKTRAETFTPGTSTPKVVKLGEGYQLERNDPLHRPWQTMPFSSYLERWKKEADAAPNDNPTPPFFTWLETQSSAHLPEMYQAYEWGSFNPQKTHGLDIPFNGAGVTYYNQSQQRQATLSLGEQGIVMNARNERATTEQARTEDSGPGFGTFALGEKEAGKEYGRFLTGSHRPGSEYHSSLFAGEPIRAAGEVRVENGKLLEITNKTGHYKTPKEQLISVLRDLKSQGYDLSQTTVRIAKVIDNKKEGLSPNITIYDMHNAETLLQNPNSPPTGIHIRVGNPDRATDQIANDVTGALNVANRETGLPLSSMRLHMFGEKDVWGADAYPRTANKAVEVLQAVGQKVSFQDNPIQVSMLELADAENEKFVMSKPVTVLTYLQKQSS